MLFEFQRTTTLRMLTVAVVLTCFNARKLQCYEKTQAALSVRFNLSSSDQRLDFGTWQTYTTERNAVRSWGEYATRTQSLKILSAKLPTVSAIVFGYTSMIFQENLTWCFPVTGKLSLFTVASGTDTKTAERQNVRRQTKSFGTISYQETSSVIGEM